MNYENFLMILSNSFSNEVNLDTCDETAVFYSVLLLDNELEEKL